MKTLIIILFLLPLAALSKGGEWVMVDTGEGLPKLVVSYRGIESNGYNACAMGRSGNYPVSRATSDGGKTWYTTLYDSSWSAPQIEDITFPYAGLCIITCDTGYYYISRDRCMSWEKKQLETYGCLGADVSFNKNNFGCIATCRYYHISFDGGETFITKYLDPDEDEFIIGIDDVQVLDDDTILLAVYKAEGFQIINAYLYISHDYGETWIKRETNTKRPTILCFLNSQEGWIAGRYKAQSHTWANYIIHTTDGGQTWEEQLDTITSAKKGLGSIKFVNDSVGYATEYWYQTWRTTNGGKNWDIIIDSQSGEIEDFFIDMACLPDGSIIAPTYTGYKYIYKYIPSGTPVNDPAATTGLNIFPNPATETARVEFTLEGFGNVRMELSDALGRRVLAIDDMYYPAGRSSAELDVSGFAPGVYYLRISTAAGAETIPLIIAR